MERNDLGNITDIVRERLRYRRKNLDLNQTQLAQKTGLTQQEVSLYEKGDREPTIQTLARLAIGLGVSADWLLGLSDETPPN